jgi:hypothetical protein
LLRAVRIEDAVESAIMDDCLRPLAEMAQIGEANAVNSGRLTSSPAAPDQPRDVEQEWSIV